jgi:hypothetical protein
MPIIKEMTTSLEDARFFNDKIDKIVRGPQSGHDLQLIRRYFRGYLHCWKTVLHLVRKAKGLGTNKPQWINWCQRWQAAHLDKNSIDIMNQLRETRDHDTHTGTIVVSGEIAAGLFPLVFVGPVTSSYVRRELVTFTKVGLDIAKQLIDTHATFV